MSAAVYSRESLVSVIGLLEKLRKSRDCYRDFGVPVQDVDQAVDFLNDRLDDEGVLDATEMYLTMK